MCDEIDDGIPQEATKRTSLKERATKRRDRLQQQVNNLNSFLDHLDKHPELEAFAEQANLI